ncbi:MAG TPA: hypothetical protein VIR60_10535 [Gammaproteobacteria bacterium]
MKHSILFVALAATLGLSACDNPTPGPAGPQGSTGEQGDTGTKGATGAQGETGGDTIVVVPPSEEQK